LWFFSTRLSRAHIPRLFSQFPIVRLPPHIPSPPRNPIPLGVIPLLQRAHAHRIQSHSIPSSQGVPSICCSFPPHYALSDGSYPDLAADAARPCPLWTIAATKYPPLALFLISFPSPLMLHPQRFPISPSVRQPPPFLRFAIILCEVFFLPPRLSSAPRCPSRARVAASVSAFLGFASFFDFPPLRLFPEFVAMFPRLILSYFLLLFLSQPPQIPFSLFPTSPLSLYPSSSCFFFSLLHGRCCFPPFSPPPV